MDLNPWVAILRATARDRSYVITRHAFRRMGERTVSEDDVARCASQGVVLEEQWDGDQVKVLVHGYDSASEEFYMIVRLSYPRPFIITVCRFREGVWEDVGTTKRRREEHR